jgi:glucosamine-phosphate N-acetyltransferase
MIPTSPRHSKSSILEQEAQALLETSDSDFLFRKLEPTDYDSGYLESLANLTKVGEISREDFLLQYSLMFPLRSDMYKIVVIYDKTKKKVIGSGSLIIELKFIR